jgi:GNAT superfamily N-acetyltransferase
VVLFLPTPTTDPDAAALLDEYFAMREHGMSGYRIVHPDPAVFTEPAGVFVVASLDHAVIGGGGIRMLDPRRAEVKHLYVRPSARGTGLGRALLEELERRASVLGATDVVLDTNARLEAAQGLYRSAGYAEVDPYNDNPNADLWLRKVLG